MAGRRRNRPENGLEILLGDTKGWGQYLDEDTVLANATTILARRTSKQDFEDHFRFFNALSLLTGYNVSQELYLKLNSALLDYILTCKKSTEADLMLCDLIVDHYPEEWIAPLIEAILKECPYYARLEMFYRELRWHWPNIRPRVAELVRTHVSSLLAADEIKRQEYGKRIIRLLDEGPQDLTVPGWVRPHKSGRDEQRTD